MRFVLLTLGLATVFAEPSQPRSGQLLSHPTETGQTVENKKKLNEEIEERFFKENCFPKPSGGCKCNEKDSQGNDLTATYDDPDKCQATTRARRDARSRSVREYLKELKEKLKGMKEGCYPRQKGCLCVIGITPEGRDITERRMNDVDCKCQEGVATKGCPTV